MIRQGWSTLKKLMFMKTAAGGGAAVEATATGNPLTFETDLARPLKSLLIPFTPVQESSGDPIVPWNGLKVWNGGKNLVDSTKRYIASDTQIYLGNTSTGYAIPLTEGTYTLAVGYKTSRSYNVYVKEQGATQSQIIRGTTLEEPYISLATFTVEESGNYRIWTYYSGEGGADNDNILWFTLVEGSKALIPTDTDISFPSPVYGGTLDAVTGKLWAEYAEYTFTGNEGFERTHNTQGTPADEGYFFRWAYDWQGFLFDNWNVGNQDVKIDSYPVYNNLNYWYSGINKGDKVAWTVSLYQGIVFRDDSYESADAFKQAIAGKKMVYKFASPVLITTLTPEQITALKGDNTIWSDADGSMTATYLKRG